MNEDQLTRLRNRLRQKVQRLHEALPGYVLAKLVRLWQFLTNDPLLAPILEELRSNKTGQLAAYRVYRSVRSAAASVGASSLNELQAKSIRPMPSILILPDKAQPQFETNAVYHAVWDVNKQLPKLATDHDYAAFVYHLLLRCFDGGWNIEEAHLVWDIQSGKEAPGNYRVFKTEVLAPFFDYLEERLDDQQALLGLLLRYKERCEWFNRDELNNIIAEELAAKKEGEKKRAEVEEVLKEDLYRYLHDQGFRFTIEPYSHKGKIDLILDQKGDRTYLEGKVFANKNPWDKAFIVKGFGQLLHYLRQFNAAAGYLLVYEICEEHLEIEGAERLGQVPFVRCDDGKIIYVLVVDIHEYEKAVSQRSMKPFRISADELRKADPPDKPEAAKAVEASAPAKAPEAVK